MFPEFRDEKQLFFRLKNNTPSFIREAPQTIFNFFEISSIDICGNLDSISTTFSENTQLGGELIS